MMNNHRSRIPEPTRPAADRHGGLPGSLQEVAQWALDTPDRAVGDLDAHLREFLDAFYRERDPDQRVLMLSAEPPLLYARADAYLAAVAEHLSLRYQLPVPAWSGAPSRFLKRPYFPGGLESLKATWLVESPTAFRRRMIFVDADPLYRPRRAEPPEGSTIWRAR